MEDMVAFEHPDHLTLNKAAHTDRTLLVSLADLHLLNILDLVAQAVDRLLDRVLVHPEGD